MGHAAPAWYSLAGRSEQHKSQEQRQVSRSPASRKGKRGAHVSRISLPWEHVRALCVHAIRSCGSQHHDSVERRRQHDSVSELKVRVSHHDSVSELKMRVSHITRRGAWCEKENSVVRVKRAVVQRHHTPVGHQASSGSLLSVLKKEVVNNSCFGAWDLRDYLWQRCVENGVTDVTVGVIAQG